LGFAEGSIKHGNRNDARAYLKKIHHNLKKIEEESKNSLNETVIEAKRLYQSALENYQMKFGEKFEF